MPDASLVNRIVHGLKAILTANVLGLVLKGALILILVRYLLSPEEYGLLFLAISVVTFGQLFSDLGLARSAARYVSEYGERDPGQIPYILRTTLLFNIGTILVVAGVLVVFSDQIAGLLNQPSLAPFLVVGAGYIAGRSLFVFCKTLFQGFGQMTWSALVTAVASVGEFVFVVGLIFLTGSILAGFVGYVAAYAVASLVGGVVLYHRFYTRFTPADHPEPGLGRRILEYNVPLASTRGSGIVLSKTDTILVGYFLNAAAVGYYTLALQIAEFVIIPAMSLGFVISPTFGEFKARGALDEATEVYESALENVLLLYLPAALGLAIVAPRAVQLVFGTDYANAVPVVQIFAAFVVLKAVDDVTHNALDYLGKARRRAYAKGGGAVANVILNAALIPVLGVPGAAVATVATYSLIVALDLVIIYGELSVSVGRLARALVRISAVTAMMALPVLWLFPYISGLLSLAAVVGLGAGIWFALSFATGLVEVDRLATVLKS